MIPPGNLRHVVNILEKTTVKDEFDGDKPVWVPLLSNVRVEKKPLSSRDILRAKAAQSEVTVRFRMRYVPGLNSTMRIREVGGETYEIDGEPIDMGSRGRWHEIMCKAVVGGS